MEKNNKIYGIPDRDYFFDSWIFIIAMLFIFPPIAIFLLLRRTFLHRRNLFKIGNTLIILGIIFFALSGLYWYATTLAEYKKEEIDLLYNFSLFHTIIGIILFILGVYNKLKARRYRKYIDLIVNKRIEDLNGISAAIHLSKNKVIKDLNTLIDKRYLERYVIDEKRNKIYLPEGYIEELNSIKNILTRVVTCKNCGASNKIEEKVGRCQYCGSYIS